MLHVSREHVLEEVLQESFGRAAEVLRYVTGNADQFEESVVSAARSVLNEAIGVEDR